MQGAVEGGAGAAHACATGQHSTAQPAGAPTTHCPFGGMVWGLGGGTPLGQPPFVPQPQCSAGPLERCCTA